MVGQCKPFIGLPGSIFAEVLERRLKRIAELEATPINASKPEIEVKPPMPRLAGRRYRRFINSKILQLCSCFQLLSQPNGLCSSSAHVFPVLSRYLIGTFRPLSPLR